MKRIILFVIILYLSIFIGCKKDQYYLVGPILVDENLIEKGKK